MSQNNLPEPGSVWQGEDGDIRQMLEITGSFVHCHRIRAHGLWSYSIQDWFAWQRNAERLVPEGKPAPPPPDRCSCAIEDWRDLPSGDVCLICKGPLVPEGRR